MQRFLRFAILLLACTTYLWTTAQTTSCSADFSYSVGYNKVVSFFTKDSLGVTHRWTWGDGSAALVTTHGTVQHTYPQPGRYEVKHFMEKPNSNCRDSVVKIITVPSLETCHASFESQRLPNVPPGAAPFIYQFNNTSQSLSGTHRSSWSFGDGATSADLNPVHGYSKTGTYQVCLRIETNAGCVSEACQRLVITDGDCNITAKFVHSSEPNDCRKVFFTNQSTPISANVHFAWKFGDGTYSHEINPTHTYTQPGKYYVCLVSEAGTNCRREYCDSVIVRCETVCNVTAKFESRHDSTEWNRINFHNLSGPVNSISKTYWSFGDGSTSQDFNSFHVYVKPGVYQVCLKEVSLNGCVSASCDSVQVLKPEACSFKAEFVHHSMTSRPLTEKFEALYQSNSAKYYWNFGDNIGGAGRNVHHSYHRPGKYHVCLTIKDRDCMATHCKEVTVGNNCDTITLRFEYAGKASRPNEVSFTAISNESLVSQVWYISRVSSNGIVNPPIAILQQKNPTYLFHEAGWYLVCLKGVTASLCYKEYCERIHIERVVNAPGQVVAYPNPATSVVSLEISLDRAEQVVLRIFDGSGSVKAEFTKSGATGNNRFDLPVQGLNQGIYLVEIKTSTRKWLSRFVKG